MSGYAFPIAYMDKQPYEDPEVYAHYGLSVLEYFAARAPQDIPQWFKHSYEPIPEPEEPNDLPTYVIDTNSTVFLQREVKYTMNLFRKRSV